MKVKKVLSLLLSLVTAITAIVVCGVSAAAESIYDTAIAIKSEEEYSVQLHNSGNIADYKITSSKAGTLSIKLTSQMDNLLVYVYNSDGEKLQVAEQSDKSGSSEWHSIYLSSSNGGWTTSCYWNSTIERYSGTLSFEIDKGDYYIRFMRKSSPYDKNTGSGKLSFTATFPSSSAKSSTKISYLSIPMKKGTTLQLSAVLSDNSGSTVTWTSSKESVATVSSKGKVTAKAAGSTIITAKVGTSSVKLRIKVTA